jgi:hypothetical protein
MMLGKVNASTVRRADLNPRPPHDGEHAPVQGRALVPVSPAPEDQRAGPSGGYPFAPFLAQLVATKDGHPQTRERRRVEPNEATAAYRAAAARI